MMAVGEGGACGSSDVCREGGWCVEGWEVDEGVGRVERERRGVVESALDHTLHCCDGVCCRQEGDVLHSDVDRRQSIRQRRTRGRQRVLSCSAATLGGGDSGGGREGLASEGREGEVRSGDGEASDGGGGVRADVGVGGVEIDGERDEAG